MRSFYPIVNVPQSRPQGLKVKIVTKPLNLLVTLAEMKNVLRVNHDNDDNYIVSLLRGVEEEITGVINRSITERSWQASYSSAPQAVKLPFGPVSAITLVERITTDGTRETIPSTDYYLEVDAFPDTLTFRSWELGRIIVTYTAGYEANEVPARIRPAIFQEVALQYKNRQDPDTGGSVVVRGLSAEALLLLNDMISHPL